MNKHIRRNVFTIAIVSIVIGCILVPLVINLLFGIEVKGILIAKWKAEDALAYSAGVLSFIGMVVLGYISYEQAKGANRMAELAAKSASEANEISMISRILEFEEKNLNCVKDCYEKFYDLHLPQNIIKTVLACMNPDHSIDVSKIQMLVDYRNDLLNSLMQYGRSLNIDSKRIKEELIEFSDIIVRVNGKAVKIMDYYSTLDLDKSVEWDVEKIKEYKEDFMEWSVKGNNYILERENKLKMVLYSKMTLEEIRELYNARL